MPTIVQQPSRRSHLLAIRTASAYEYVRVARPLALALFADPVFDWITPDPARRAAQLPTFFELMARPVLRHGASHVAADGAGAALWVPPGAEAIPAEEADDLAAALGANAGGDGERLAAVTGLVEERRPAGSFYYLEFLGMAPAWQGRGGGTALLAAGLARCDREGVPAFLDATSPRNRDFYERHGFEVIGELAPQGGPPLWQMWREPLR
jgi:ribosomal protein S18 acetylase RimI-like enzyme